MKSSITGIAIILLSALVISGCGAKKTTGTPASADTPTVPLAEILSNPAIYSGKQVILQGTVSGQCPSLCDFTYKENGSSATIYMQAPLKAPRMQPGSKVRVTTSVLQGERQLVFTALGLEIL